MRRSLLLGVALALPLSLWADQPAVTVEPVHLEGPRPLQKQTQQAVVRDYLESWQSLSQAFEQNRIDLLNADFTGTAHDKLNEAIQQQASLGIHTRYQVQSHDIQIVFYSPEGLSVQLVDNVVYDQQVLDQDKVLATQQVHTRYVVVLTPAEVRWRVRVLQAQPDSD